jgi:hypothetical protein
MFNLDRIDKYAEVRIEVGEPGNLCRVRTGSRLDGCVSVIPRQKFSFALHLYLVREDECIYKTASDKQTSSEVVQSCTLGVVE